MEFLLYLTPIGREIIQNVYKVNYHVQENVGYCRDENIFGYADFKNKFVICTNNIKISGFDVRHHVNQTVYHEAVHVGHLCNGYKPFGISLNDMSLPSNKLQDVRNSVKASTASYRIEHEAYWMEDKPEKVKYVIQKYCL
jgi:hypothetical protein